MGRRSSDTLLFPGPSGLAPEEPIYEVDGIPVEGEGAIVRQRPAAPRRLRPAGETRRPRVAASADATADLSRARTVSRATSERPSRGSARTDRRRPRRAASQAVDDAERPGRTRRSATKRGIGAKMAALPRSVAAKASSLTGTATATDEKPRQLEASVLKRPWLVAIAAVLVAALFLYAPVRDLYWAHRDNEVLTAQAAALDESNAEALARAKSLSTEEGIKDEARLHGYVEKGEEAATVEGLPGQEDESEAAPVPTDVANEVLQQEDPWYVKALDTVFGYDKTARN